MLQRFSVAMVANGSRKMVHSADSAGHTVHPAKGYKYQKVMKGRFNKKKKTGKPKIGKHNTETMYSVASNKQLT